MRARGRDSRCASLNVAGDRREGVRAGVDLLDRFGVEDGVGAGEVRGFGGPRGGGKSVVAAVGRFGYDRRKGQPMQTVEERIRPTGSRSSSLESSLLPVKSIDTLLLLGSVGSCSLPGVRLGLGAGLLPGDERSFFGLRERGVGSLRRARVSRVRSGGKPSNKKFTRRALHRRGPYRRTAPRAPLTCSESGSPPSTAQRAEK